MPTTIGARRKLARDLRPGDSGSVSGLGAFGVRAVTLKTARGRVIVTTESGTRITLRETDAVTPC